MKKETAKDFISVNDDKVFKGTREALEKKFFKGKKTSNLEIARWARSNEYALEINGLRLTTSK